MTPQTSLIKVKFWQMGGSCLRTLSSDKGDELKHCTSNLKQTPNVGYVPVNTWLAFWALICRSQLYEHKQYSFQLY